MKPEEILKDKYNIEIPPSPMPGGLYTPVIQTGNLLYVSGQTPTRNGKLLFQGKLGRDFSVEEGQEAARIAILNCLALIKDYLGDLEKIKHFVQVIGYVRSAEEFGNQPAVMNGASGLLLELFGDKGGHARLALGTNELPGGAAVEVTCIVEL